MQELKLEFENKEVKATSVTCLGITFESDEARRTYFREELRRKLPELKQIEGFPIGEDEDIIRLSDPPYYTACPNPWLNDFIAEWEKEKIELEEQGKRQHDFKVEEPYASDVSEGKNNSIYMAHAYHTKVPHPAIMRYILHYTQPGDIVFDGFAGTGMTGVAANLCGSAEDVAALREPDAKVGVRHSICSDLSPIASLIAANYNLPFDPVKFEKKANAILKQVEQEYGWMYETEVNGKRAKVNYTVWSDVFICPNCNKELTLWDEAVSLEKNEIKNEFPCSYCGTLCSKKNMEKAWETYFDTVLKKPVSMIKTKPVLVNYRLGKSRKENRLTDFDFELLKNIDKIETQNIAPFRMPEGSEARRNDRAGIKHIHQFYTKRNLIYLNRVYELIEDDPFLKAWFTSTLQRTTKSYKFTLDRKFGILSGTLYIPSLNVELYPFNILSRKIRDFTKTSYLQRGNSVISINSATKLSFIDDNSIDYMFIDPPFGANIMYSELSAIWEGWIKVQTNNKEEAIINQVQQKTLFEYQSLMNRSLREFYRILKPGKWITIEFSNTSASVWNSIQNALQGVGFVVVNVSALDKKQGTFKAVTTTTAVKQDLVITCYKPSAELLQKFETTQDKSENVWSFIEELLLRLPVHLVKDNSTTTVVERNPKILYDRLISYYVQHGYNVPLSASEFQKGLRERFVERDGMFFTPEQVIEYEEKKAKAPDIVPMALFIGSEIEGIEWLKRELKTAPKTYQELQPRWMQDLVTPKKGDELPEMMQILEENFLKDEEGRWYKPDLENEADLEKVRTRKLLKEFNMYVEMASKPNTKIRTVRLEALRAGFKEAYSNKDFATIVQVGNRLPESLLMEDEALLQYYDIASSRV
ncbi:MAG TPA: site-specific DNA-methyltransferase [Bacteroidales bacterium]|nr:site-specific DNA-methyltransferase [Bacteroidales bacterium]